MGKCHNDYTVLENIKIQSLWVFKGVPKTGICECSGDSQKSTIHKWKNSHLSRKYNISTTDMAAGKIVLPQFLSYFIKFKVTFKNHAIIGVSLSQESRVLWVLIGANITARKMKFPIKDLFSKFYQIDHKLWIQSHLLKKSFMENFIFCAVYHDLTYEALKSRVKEFTYRISWFHSWIWSS